MDSAMKNSIAVILLALLCLGLGIGVVAMRKQAKEKQMAADARIAALSNEWVTTRGKLEDQMHVNTLLERDLTTQKDAYSELTNNYAQLSGTLVDVNANLSRTAASLKATEDEVKKRDAQIAELSTQNTELDKKALDLDHAITNLTAQIAETQRQLAASEGDRVFLEGELKRMIAEKSELERQFNDLTVLRAQVVKLKEELSIARRIEWIRRGLFASTEEKGASKLLGIFKTSPEPQPASYDLNVEVGSDGTVRVVPPVSNTPISTQQ
jgi:chromosome segregation ATPase